ncbi:MULTISPECIES: DUF4232 domain-containing protein [Streptomyces]|jgi:hypothetical protein|uniref:DUF4232 domain-containing protein n=1 Tax=Streptomyces thermoviolaceus subsp. thermoviolaceus TaxID=66860 RepID=A0ABX0YX41_STRTL|nr:MULTISPECIES: DUF4232 domain-containing protein [Streptomyces]GGW25887.1 hypothetical protein GCM10010294_70770 [Streptomyces griseoloalbus]MCM3265378.1 DUF4232 domain-containing protein [Streptomyces thermoviolaceus]NJP16469.1 DUF4232 domain-containing protein [Streptomyces thermoviolaceus subsp. thermoviolaceus]RSR95246.1 DUF4232 domain-containing protein [Streptomyces sp. WAC00469]WTD48158.1 DUF4232 domain-containing protein [Streptomyces thermoviolaceus]
MRALPIRVAALAAALTAALALTSCGHDGGTEDSHRDTGDSGDTGSKNTDVAACRPDDVTLTAGPVSAAPAAGDTGQVPVTLTNRGARCSLRGFPVVRLKSDSTTWAVPADRTSTPRDLTLATGDAALFTLTYVRGREGDGTSLPATSLTVALPGTAHGTSFSWSYGPVGATATAGTPDASVTAFQLAGD